MQLMKKSYPLQRQSGIALLHALKRCWVPQDPESGLKMATFWFCIPQSSVHEDHSCQSAQYDDPQSPVPWEGWIWKIWSIRITIRRFSSFFSQIVSATNSIEIRSFFTRNWMIRNFFEINHNNVLDKCVKFLTFIVKQTQEILQS